ncbi:MAG: histidine kinase [Actinomycetia bacterium]|nr:histidine kinase [Actinomycetes bacterium]
MEDKNDRNAFQYLRVLEAANLTLPYLRTGLSLESAKMAGKIIFEKTDADAVAITDFSNVLSFTGLGCEHHLSERPIITKATKEALAANEMRVLTSREEIGCPLSDCPLKAAIIVPLEMKEKPVGALKFYYDSPEKITEIRKKLAGELGKILSTQIELSEIDRLETLSCQAELKALQAQINPHFLFNTLNNISSFCRTDPEKARSLLLHFAEFFRKTLKTGEELITIKEELDYVDSYLVLEKARFGKRLKVNVQIAPEILELKVPPLTIQPLVENSIRHGFKSEGELRVNIRVKAENGSGSIVIEDNGSGISEKNLGKIFQSGFGKGLGVGISNINERLKTWFGSDYEFEIKSSPGTGTKAILKIPIKK